MPSYHLIYIPGLGDRKVTYQQKAVNTWRLWGVRAELFQMNWADKEPWKPKLERLVARIDTLAAQDKRVALVGASAGAAAVINAYAARKNKITGCVLIAGKVNRPENIRSSLRKQNPAFITAAYDCQKALETLDDSYRKRILCLHALVDETVSRPDSRVPGASNRTLPTISHVLTITATITIGPGFFIKFLKRL